VLEFGERFGDPGSHGGRGGVGRELLEAEDLGGVDLLEAGGQGGGLVVAVGGGVGGGEQFGAAGAEDVLGEEQAADLVQLLLEALTMRGWPGWLAASAVPAGVRGHS
jgi:hypothetical protein